MPIRRTRMKVGAHRLRSLAGSLLDASTLCAIATTSAGARAHVNTAYFAWSDRLDLVWLSDPEAVHSRNVRERSTVAIAVYDSHQSWDRPDRGIQLFGTAWEATGPVVSDAATVYATRFPQYRPSEFAGYRLYRFRPKRLKVFDEDTLGPGVFVTAAVHQGRLAWVRTEFYEPAPAPG